MKFCGECGAALSTVEAHEPELRQLTILFCDMVGSTELSTRIDPETLASVMHDYYVMCEQVITDAGGYVVKFHGDGVLACFGAPIALDDAALRGVQAACELVAATARLVGPDGEPLVARAGVHSGPVVVGVTGVGSGLKAIDVLGEAANLAARLQGAAEPGEVIISAELAALVPPYVQLVDGADLTLKGINRPVRAYRVAEIGQPADELHHRARADEARLVGREAEMAILLGRCHLAAQGSPQFVVLVGEPGIGKSRLLRELRDSPARPPGRTVVLRGLQDRSTTPFAPLLELVARHADELPAVLTADLAALLRPDRSSGDKDTPDRRRARSIDAVCDGLLGLADEQLVLLMLDDVQWFDPSTLELLAVLRSRAADTRLAVLASARPEWVSPWPGSDDVTVLPLPRLAPDAIRRMLADLDIHDDVLVGEVIERSEGVPLFLEEYVRTQRDPGVAMAAVPHTVADLLRARLERLGPDLEFARECSVFGRDVDVEVAAKALATDPEELRERLRALSRADVLRERARGRTFSFQHVLLRDAAYDSMLRARRRTLHRSAATAITDLGPSAMARFAEQLARHWTEADEHDEAYRAWLRAGRLAADRTALAEAMRNFERAEEALRELPPTPERDRKEVRLILASGPVVTRLLGGGHPSLSEMYARADRLSANEADPSQRAQVLIGLYSFWVSQPDFRSAEANLPRLLDLADDMPALAAVADFFAGSTMHMIGRFDRACEYLVRAMELLQRAEPFTGHALLVHSNGLIADMTMRTDRAAGQRWYDAAFDSLAHLGEPPFERAWLELTLAKSLALLDDVAGAAMHGGRAAEIAAEFALAQVAVQADCLMAWVDAVLLGGDEPLQRMSVLLDRFDTCGSRADLSMFLVFHARALRERDRHEEAVAAVARALAYMDETGEGLHREAALAEQAALSGSH